MLENDTTRLCNMPMQSPAYHVRDFVNKLPHLCLKQEYVHCIIVNPKRITNKGVIFFVSIVFHFSEKIHSGKMMDDRLMRHVWNANETEDIFYGKSNEILRIFNKHILWHAQENHEMIQFLMLFWCVCVWGGGNKFTLSCIISCMFHVALLANLTRVNTI